MTRPIMRLPTIIPGSEPMSAAEVGQRVDWGLAGQRIPDTWARTKGKGVLVAILDTGRSTHPDMKDAIVDAADFVGEGLDDRNGHGTHVAGTIGARNQVGNTICGVAPEVSIICGKVLGADGSGSSDGIVQGIKWAIAHHADIISMSLGGGYDRGTADALLLAVNAGVKVVVAAGNSGQQGDNTVEYPAKLGFCCAIAAYNKAGKIADFSSRGPEVWAAFPGQDITSCWLNGQFRVLSGTSMATPFCSGVTALRLSYEKAIVAAGGKVEHPTKTQADLKALLRQDAIDAGSPGRDNSWGWGMLDTNKFLLDGVTAAPVAPPPPVTPPPTQPIPGEIIIPTTKGLLVMKPVTVNGEAGVFTTVR